MDHPPTMRLELVSADGATAVEYALMLVFIAVVIIAAVVILGTQTSATFDCAADEIAAGGTAGC